MSVDVGDPREGLATGLTGVLSEHLNSAVSVANLRRLSGGSSNETWAFDITTARDNEPLPLVLRRSFIAGQLEMRLDVEFKLLEVLYRLSLPVPQPWLCVTANPSLGSPFMIMTRAPGADLRKVLDNDPDTASRSALGDELVSVLADLHAVDWHRECGNALSPPSGNVALEELQRWAPVVESHATEHPLIIAALVWLRANAPDNATLCLVHGDFKANNLLYGEGRIQAVIDWELAHIGDPYEDLAWTMLWDTVYDVVNGVLPEQEFLARYAHRTATSLDPERLLFWRVFSLVKLASIFFRGLRDVHGNAPVRPMLLQLVRAVPYLEERIAHLLNTSFDSKRG